MYMYMNISIGMQRYILCLYPLIYVQTSTNKYKQVQTSTNKYKQYHTAMYWFILVCTGMYWYKTNCKRMYNYRIRTNDLMHTIPLI